MNSNTVPTPEKKRGIVTSFASFSTQMLQSMKTDLGLYMTVDQLASLQIYYKKIAHRDPSLDEIYFLDAIVEKRLYQNYPISKFITDYPTIADTYADIMQKYSDVFGIQNAPTLNSLMDVARLYIEKAGKKAPLQSNAIFESGELAQLNLMLKKGAPTVSAYNSILGQASPCDLTAGQLIVMLSKWGSMSDSDLHTALAQLLSTVSASPVVSGTLTWGKGLLMSLYEYNMGTFIDITALPVAQPAELTSLCDRSLNAGIVIISAENVNPLLKDASKLGVWASVIGSLTSDKQFTVRTRNGATLEYPIAFIKQLMTPTQAIQVLPDNAHSFTANARGYACRTVSDTADHVLAAHCSCATFFNALYTTLSAVSDCVAAGASYKDICIAYDIRQPVTKNCNDIAIACLLGAYRAQIEFYIPNIQSKCTSVFGAPSFTVHAMSRIELSTPHQYTADDHNDSSLYLLCPQIEPNGLVDFEQLRRMWDYVTALVKNGDILYAAAVSPSGVDATISALTQNTSTLIKSDMCTDTLLSSLAPGGILAITRTRLDGVFLGNLKVICS